jgi:hypothetical protein
VFRSETQIPISIPAGGTLSVNLVMQNREAGEYEQPVTFYLAVEGRLIEQSVVLKGSAINAIQLEPSSGGENGNND